MKNFFATCLDLQACQNEIAVVRQGDEICAQSYPQMASAQKRIYKPGFSAAFSKDSELAAGPSPCHVSSLPDIPGCMFMDGNASGGAHDSSGKLC
jgi:hypothetical protein